MNEFLCLTRPATTVFSTDQTSCSVNRFFAQRPALKSRAASLASFAAAMSLGLGIAAALTAPAVAQTTVTALRGARTPLALSAPANARCELRTMSPRSTRPLDAFSDAHGVVRYFVTLRADAHSGALATLECRNAAAHTLTALTIVPGALAAPAPRPRSMHMPSIADLDTNARFGVLPGTPAGFDVTRADERQLAALGYPHRPDEHLSPMAYRLWRKLVTTPGALVAPGAVANPKVHGPAKLLRRRASQRSLTSGVTTSAAASPNWSGVVVTNVPSPFASVYGEWRVPAVSTDGHYGSAYASSWVGLDGFGTNDVVQDGTEQDAYNFAFLSFESYYAWYEFFPDSEKALSNVSVSPDDVVFAYSTTFFDGNGALNGSYFVWDETSGTGTFASEVIPAGTAFPGSSAEWIEERPTVGGALGPMPDYGNAQMTTTYATTSDGSMYWADGSNYIGANDVRYDVLMTSDGSFNTNLLSYGYIQDANHVNFRYFNWL